jgi:hypothetical protein
MGKSHCHHCLILVLSSLLWPVIEILKRLYGAILKNS